MSRLSVTNIRKAANVIDPVFLNTPQFSYAPLSHELGVDVTLKVETLNPVRCFKGRGADYLMSSLDRGARIVSASAGNLGQALAYTGARRGVGVTIFAAETASPLKVARMRDLGAEVILEGADFDAAKAVAKIWAARQDLPMIEDGVAPALSEGAGTIAAELARDRAPDVMLVALGNGAILSGIATWMQSEAPQCEVIGVAADGAPCMALSWRAGTAIETGHIDTIADGMATRCPVPEALSDLQGRVADIVTVSDAQMIEGLRLLDRHLGLSCEASAAAGLAAILSDPGRFAGRRVATVLCGANITDDQRASWLG